GAATLTAHQPCDARKQSEVPPFRQSAMRPMDPAIHSPGGWCTPSTCHSAASKKGMKIFLSRVAMLLLAVSGFCQSGGVNPPMDPRTNMEGFPASRLSAEPPSVKDLSKSQTMLWRAREQGNAKLARAILPDTAAVVSSTDAVDGKQFTRQIEAGVCHVKSFKLEDFKFHSANPTTAVLTYDAIQDAACNGHPLPRTLRVQVGYDGGQGRWKISFYVEESQRP
ncbi:MAG: DUF4440 domain-containing protein, partial [Terracidiphilus sp.]